MHGALDSQQTEAARTSKELDAQSTGHSVHGEDAEKVPLAQAASVQQTQNLQENLKAIGQRNKNHQNHHTETGD